MGMGAPALANEPIKAVGSTFVSPYLKTVFGKLIDAGLIVPPKEDFRGTERGLADFCSSSAPDSASLLSMSRRMRITEFEACVRNGVPAIIEIPFGFSTLALAAGRNDVDFELTLQQFYAAVARELPADDEFRPNPNKRWRDIDPSLPDLPIRVVLPGPGLGSRVFFNDRFLEAACRGITAIKYIFSAEARVRQCVQVRTDGVIVDVPLPYDQGIRQAMTNAPAGTIAVMPFKTVSEMAEIVKVLPLDGVLPSPTTVVARTYPFNRPLFVYIKKAHVKDHRGNGPVAGLREVITELTRERTVGPDGYLAAEGIVPIGDERRVEERERALRLAIMER